VSVAPKVMVNLPLSPCSSVNFCFKYFKTIFLEASKFITVTLALGEISVSMMYFFYLLFYFFLSVLMCFRYIFVTILPFNGDSNKFASIIFQI
jgi:hypothetical protein